MKARNWAHGLSLAGWFVSGVAVAGDLASRVETTIITLPHSLEASSSNWCTLGSCSVGPRLYHAPTTNGEVLVGWTDSSGNGHVSRISGAVVGTTHDFPGTPIKGLVAHQDGGFAALLWDSTSQVMSLTKRAADGAEVWSADLNEYGDPTSIFNNNIGDSRLAYGNGAYGAYYSVHCAAGWCAGHEGDQYKWVSDDGVVSTRWIWGCSHSMAQLVGYHPGMDTLTALCSSDCFPSKGLHADHTHLLFESDGNCGGMVALQLGQMAAGNSTWKVVFNAVDSTCCPAKGIGFASFDPLYAPTIVWLTDSSGDNERDPVLARLQGLGTTERYLVGWTTLSDGDFHLGIIDGGGVFLEGPEPVGAQGIGWGYRNDSFRSHADGAVSWIQGAASSSTLRFYRFLPDLLIFSDGFESGDTAAWSQTVP